MRPEFFTIIADARLALRPDLRGGLLLRDPRRGWKGQGSGAAPACAFCVCRPGGDRRGRCGLAVAEQACERQKRILVAAMERQAEKHGLTKVAAAGTGEGLIAGAAAFLGLECIRLSERYGARISDVFPAYAVARLAETE